MANYYRCDKCTEPRRACVCDLPNTLDELMDYVVATIGDRKWHGYVSTMTGRRVADRLLLFEPHDVVQQFVTRLGVANERLARRMWNTLTTTKRQQAQRREELDERPIVPLPPVDRKGSVLTLADFVRVTQQVGTQKAPNALKVESGLYAIVHKELRQRGLL